MLGSFFYIADQTKNGTKNQKVIKDNSNKPKNSKNQNDSNNFNKKAIHLIVNLNNYKTIADTLNSPVEKITFQQMDGKLICDFLLNKEVINKIKSLNNEKPIEKIVFEKGDVDDNNLSKVLNSLYNDEFFEKLVINNCSSYEALTKSKFNVEVIENDMGGNPNPGDLIRNIMMGMFGQAPGGNPNDKKQSLLEKIRDHIRLMDPVIKTYFEDLYRKVTQGNSKMNVEGNDDQNLQRLQLVLKLPTFKPPVLLKSTNVSPEEYNNNFLEMRDLLKRLMDKLIIGMNEIKESVIESLLKIISEHKDATVNNDPYVFPSTVYCFVGQPGVGKTSFGKAVAGTMALIDLIDEYYKYGTIFNEEVLHIIDQKKMKITKEEEALIKKRKLTESVKILLIKQAVSIREYYVANLKLNEEKDSAAVLGFAQTYKNSKTGKIIDVIAKDIGYFPDFVDGTPRKRFACVFIGDEIDKFCDRNGVNISNDFLSIVDSNRQTYVDSFLQFPIDLRKIWMCFTSNSEETLSAPLKNRFNMTVIPSFMESEKIVLAKKFFADLIEDDMPAQGIPEDSIKVDDSAIQQIIKWFGRSTSGIRDVQKAIESIWLNAVATYKKTKKPIKITSNNLDSFISSSMYGKMNLEDDSKFVNRKGNVICYIRNKHHELKETRIIISAYELKNMYGSLSLLGGAGDVSERYPINAERYIEHFIQSVVYQLPLHLTSSVRNALNRGHHTIYVKDEFYIKDVNEFILHSVIGLFSYIKKQPVNPHVAVLASVDNQGFLTGTENVIEKLKFVLSSNNGRINQIILSKNEEKYLRIINDLIKSDAKSQKVKITFVEDIKGVLDIVLPSTADEGSSNT
jgi:hypothetical protein